MEKLCFATNTITSYQPIKDRDNNTLNSPGNIFELGFFSPRDSKLRYVGLWYKTTPTIIVWVANRNNPITDSSGELQISNDSNQLVLLNSSKTIVWSSNSSSDMVGKNVVAELLDSGNLVLKDVADSENSEHYFWQSFDFPTDTQLPGMKLGWDSKSGLNRYLTSWKSIDDPSEGNFTYKMNITSGLPFSVLAEGSTIKYRSGAWNGVQVSSIPMLSDNTLNYTFIVNENESLYMCDLMLKSAVTTRLTLSYLGMLDRFIIENKSSGWDIMYSRPSDPVTTMATVVKMASAESMNISDVAA